MEFDISKMKLGMTLKSPDCFDYLVDDAVEAEILMQEEEFNTLESWEQKQIKEGLREEIQEKLSKWVKFNEQIHVEFDFETMTAKVVDL
jgi:hypothetical protein